MSSSAKADDPVIADAADYSQTATITGSSAFADDDRRIANAPPALLFDGRGFARIPFCIPERNGAPGRRLGCVRYAHPLAPLAIGVPRVLRGRAPLDEGGCASPALHREAWRITRAAPPSPTSRNAAAPWPAQEVHRNLFRECGVSTASALQFLSFIFWDLLSLREPIATDSAS